ncbi:hypothetical protein [Nocardia sp. NPDC004604]|uniref:hypothetical protein n=1 Tax=Nocardia sp. NPDC004604 TaxID=3157013 RepID=UPI0033A6CA0B
MKASGGSSPGPNHTGQLTVTEGTDSIVGLAMIDADGPTGIFVDRFGPVAW